MARPVSSPQQPKGEQKPDDRLESSGATLTGKASFAAGADHNNKDAPENHEEFSPSSSSKPLSVLDPLASSSARISKPRYDIKEEVGSGGMSVVYRAIDTFLDREVAVKILHRHLACRKEERERFSREAKAVARLKHPSILEIYDYAAKDESEVYIVSEFIRGPTLRHFVETEGTGLPEIGALIGERLASALTHAHSEGIIHRDVKPENIMIQFDGTVKLTDFGIAKMVDRDERMTQTGTLLGSPAHMPPEIIAGEERDHRVDIFSLGTVLYWLSCETMPYQGTSPAEVLRRIVDSEHVDPRTIDPRVSDNLAEIILKAMARDPSSRHTSAKELQEQLANYLAGLEFQKTTDELALFFKDPTTYKRNLRKRLIELLMRRGREAVAQKRIASAISSFDRVLALHPGHEEAIREFDLLRKKKARSVGFIGAISSAALIIAIAGLFFLTSFSEVGDQHPVEGLSQTRVEQEALDHQKDLQKAAGLPKEEGSKDIESSDLSSIAQDRVEELPQTGQDLPTVPATSGKPNEHEDDADTFSIKARNEEHRRVNQPSNSDGQRVQGRQVSLRSTPYEAPKRPLRVLVDTWADISIDGETLARDREARSDLKPGTYRLSIQREGFVPIEESIKVTSGDEVLELRHRLVPRPALIRIVNHQRAAVTLNDNLIGTATEEGFEIPITFPEQPDGRFRYPVTATIVLEKPGYQEKRHSIRLRPGQVESIVTELEPQS